MTDTPALESVQRWMQDALIFPRQVTRRDVARHLAGSPRLSGADGLAIYQRGYFLRIAQCMREQFPALCHALGAPLFNDFVAEYIRDCPPESHTLYDLGRRFPRYLEASRPEQADWADFMVDLATFERRMFVLFDAPGQEGKPFADPATPDEKLRLQPCFAVAAYRFPVALYYHDVRRKRLAAVPERADSFAALVRTDYVTRTVLLHAPHYRFLHVMAEGGQVADGIVAVARDQGMTADAVWQAWRAPDGVRRRWIEGGFFVAAE